MRSWIFKISDQRSYADVEGVRYEYDNRHSVRVRPGDEKIAVARRDGSESEAPSTTGTASLVPSSAPEELLVAVTPSGSATSNGAEAPRRAADPARVGLTAEEIVHEFLARGELERLGGTALQWRSRGGAQPGWDFEYKDRHGEVNAAEVKGTTAVRFASIEVTANEWRAAAELRHRYWLYLVADCWGAKPQIQRIQDPFARMERGEISAVPVVWRITRLLDARPLQKE